MRSRRLVALHLLLAAGVATPGAAMHAGRRCITCERVADAAAAPRSAAARVVRRDAVRRAEAAPTRPAGGPAAARAPR